MLSRASSAFYGLKASSFRLSVAAFLPTSFSKVGSVRFLSTVKNFTPEFCTDAFKIFDLNGDNKIQPEEIHEAYKYNSAGSEMNRLIEKHELGGKGVTWESLDLLDLNVAVKKGKVELDPNGDIERAEFDKWLSAALDEFQRLENSLEGSQVEHE
eukprot:CAMPEP_0167756046 /NCGR_PEP_ID=MMETSP0110_2-20121227/9161_1 /TAXON_ID=629695 /ORGANISM="Gymnochlora sp., Strain CCMP2014" /LENGTH=154 /DNA_ID=CAMNT_0007642099 /DNA_START=55 /DNA_END=519 /DNA_ORIENTATION=+